MREEVALFRAACGQVEERLDVMRHLLADGAEMAVHAVLSVRHTVVVTAREDLVRGVVLETDRALWACGIQPPTTPELLTDRFVFTIAITFALSFLFYRPCGL